MKQRQNGFAAIGITLVAIILLVVFAYTMKNAGTDSDLVAQAGRALQINIPLGKGSGGSGGISLAKQCPASCLGLKKKAEQASLEHKNRLHYQELCENTKGKDCTNEKKKTNQALNASYIAQSNYYKCVNDNKAQKVCPRLYPLEKTYYVKPEERTCEFFKEYFDKAAKDLQTRVYNWYQCYFDHKDRVKINECLNGIDYNMLNYAAKRYDETLYDYSLYCPFEVNEFSSKQIMNSLRGPAIDYLKSQYNKR